MSYQLPEPEIPGWMSPDELRWLYELGIRCQEIAEVGSWQGRSTHAILTGRQDSGEHGTVYAVDTFKGSPSEINTNHELAKHANIRELFERYVGHFPQLIIIEKASSAAAQLFEPEALDAVFIDAEHTFNAVLLDLLSWGSRVRTGGILCGHDRDQDGVPEALRTYLGILPPRVRGSLWAVRREFEPGWLPLSTGSIVFRSL